MLHHIFQKVLLPAALAGTMLAGTSAPAVSLAAQAATQPDSYHDDWLHVNDNAEIVDYRQCAAQSPQFSGSSFQTVNSSGLLYVENVVPDSNAGFSGSVV